MNFKFYFLIPINDKHLFIDGLSTKEMIGEVHPSLFKEEDDDYYDFNGFDITRTLDDQDYCEKNNLPYYIIVVQVYGNLYELVTGNCVTTDKYADFEVHDISEQNAKKYFEETKYREKIGEFYKDYIKNIPVDFECEKKLVK